MGAVTCGACKVALSRWVCELCSMAVCPACLGQHAIACRQKPDPTTTVGLLELALQREPWKTCSCPSASDRCGACRRHDELREKIEAALKAARCA
jgi:hypothetical protein